MAAARRKVSTTKLALFGSPVSHSPSPRVHGMFAEQFGLDVEYRLIEAPPDRFAEELRQFRNGGGVGCNITLPLKEFAFKQARHSTERARLARAANTLWWTDDGACQADNTDGFGLVQDLEKNVGFEIREKKVLLIGAGGAAAGVLGALLDRKPARILIANRTIAKARALAKRHASLGNIRTLSLNEVNQAGPVDLVIEATSMGHSSKRPEISSLWLRDAEFCYSLSYGRAVRWIRSLCQESGTPFLDGIGMLVEQAAESFEIWTGNRPHTASVHEQLRAELSRN